MRESVIYQDIVQKEAFKIVSLFLQGRFGNVDEVLIKRIRNLSAEKLETLAQCLPNFAEISDLVVWLEKQEEENQNNNSTVN
ncbi:MAG TPA: DUF4351 domain-containing protein [Nostocaceae cyanobacterium]|nr:DUF4351 domain-containing protein [Nostocaceae cyanobacterium]